MSLRWQRRPSQTAGGNKKRRADERHHSNHDPGEHEHVVDVKRGRVPRVKMGIEALRTKAKEQAAIDKVLKNIKAEIEREGEMYPDGDWYISIDRVCEIIDKHTSRK